VPVARDSWRCLCGKAEGRREGERGGAAGELNLFPIRLCSSVLLSAYELPYSPVFPMWEKMLLLTFWLKSSSKRPHSTSWTMLRPLALRPLTLSLSNLTSLFSTSSHVLAWIAGKLFHSERGEGRRVGWGCRRVGEVLTWERRRGGGR